MAYMSQEKKATLAPAIKAVLKKYGMKGSISVRNHSTLAVTLSSGKMKFSKFLAERKYGTVNHYHMDKAFDGKELEFMNELYNAMSTGNHNRSDIMTDLFDVGWYIEINVGKWDKEYQVA